MYCRVVMFAVLLLRLDLTAGTMSWDQALPRSGFENSKADDKTARELDDNLRYAGVSLGTYFLEHQQEVMLEIREALSFFNNIPFPSTAKLLENLVALESFSFSLEINVWKHLNFVAAIALFSLEPSRQAASALKALHDPSKLECDTSYNLFEIASLLMDQAVSLMAASCDSGKTNCKELTNLVFANSFSEAVSLFNFVRWGEVEMTPLKTAFLVSETSTINLELIKKLSACEIYLEIKRFKSSRLFQPLALDDGRKAALPLPQFIDAYGLTQSRDPSCAEAADQLVHLSTEKQALEKFTQNLNEGNTRSYICALNILENHGDTRSNFMLQLFQLNQDSFFYDSLRYLNSLDDTSRQNLFSTDGFDASLRSDDEMDLVSFILIHGPNDRFGTYSSLLMFVNRENQLEIVDKTRTLLQEDLKICGSTFHGETQECRNVKLFSSRNYVGMIALIKFPNIECSLVESVLSGEPLYESVDDCTKWQEMTEKELINKIVTNENTQGL